MIDSGTLLWMGTAAVVACAMEPWAAFAHGKLWHGVLWNFHESHHVDTEGIFEKNDWFALLHALPAMALIIAGAEAGDTWAANLAFGAGIGMTIFGAGYAIVHDGLVHGRLPVKFLLRFRVMRRIHGAHLRHHTTGEEPYGMFLGPQELQRAVREGKGRLGKKKSAA